MFIYMSFLALSSGSMLDEAVAAQPDPQGLRAAVRTLAELPNTKIHYYDVDGNDVASINRSIARLRPSVAGRPLPASASWTVTTSFKRRTENGQCKVDAATATFAATAELPRLVNEQAIKPALMSQWRNYVEGLEANELPTLVFVYSQLDAVKNAILTSRCEDAKAVAAAAVQRLQASAAEFDLARQKQLRKTEQMFADAGLFNTPTVKPVCKDLLASGSRLNTLKVCMAPREWELLHANGQKATREMQDIPRLNKPF